MEDKAGNEASFWFGDRHGCWARESGHCFMGIREPPMTLPALLSVRFGLHAAVRPAGSGESTGEFPPLRAGADGRLQLARELHALSRVRAPPARAKQALISAMASWSKLAAGLHPSCLRCRPAGGRVSGKGACIPAGPAHFPASPVQPILYISSARSRSHCHTCCLGRLGSGHFLLGSNGTC